MKIYLASDHAGFAHKNVVRDWLRNEKFEVHDCGAESYDALDDFPDYVSLVGQAISKSPKTDRGIIFGGSGQGEAMMANRYPNVRATVFYGGPDDIITLSREHNDANVLSIGARFVSVEDTMRVVWDWLHTDFTKDERHIRRIKKIVHLTREIERRV